MVRMVCLANSWRPGGRCVAGIDLETGEWVRPVPKRGSAIPEGATQFGGHELAPLDVVEVELGPPTLATKFQRENRVITSSTWKLVGQVEGSDLLQYCDKSSSVLHGPHKVAEPTALEALPPKKWKSLELRHVKAATFHKDPRKRNRWLVDFTVAGLTPTHLILSLTDPIATARLNGGRKLKSECLLTISLTEPIAMPQYKLPELCYKLVAAVIEM